MSLSPPMRRLSNASTGSKREETLINAYEAEEERIINVLSRKLEQLREEKIDLENALEAESESHVNRLSRELTALRLAQQQQQNGGSTGASSAASIAPSPSAETMLEAMLRENEQLRCRLVDTERDYVRITRLNEIYREELIEHRRQLGLPVDNLIGLSSADPYSQSTHRRSISFSTTSSSPSSAILTGPSSRAPPAPAGVPIPRPPSQIRRPAAGGDSSLSSSADSPSVFSPSYSTHTSATTPPSSASLVAHTFGRGAAQPLSYPSVPPPSLSSSVAGSPNVGFHMPPEARSRGNSVGAHHRRGSSVGGYRRRESVERGARIAETGTLVPRSRANSVAEVDAEEALDLDLSGRSRHDQALL